MSRSRSSSLLSGVDAIETRSIMSMHELEPSPTGDYFPDLHNASTSEPRSVGISRLGLKSHNWDYWLSAIQRYSTYPPTVFFALHAANTSLIPLVTRSVPSSESFLLLTRPIYQSPSLEPLMVALPICAHIASGLSLRSIRARRRARMYGAESRSQRHLIKSWPVPSLQAKLGYAMIPLLSLHVGINRAIPLQIDGGSSSVGLGYVAHGFARSPFLWNLFYILFVATSVWHMVGGLATWMGIRVTTVRTERDQTHKTGILGETRPDQQKRRKNKWLVHGIAALTTAIWLAGGLGILSCILTAKHPRTTPSCFCRIARTMATETANTTSTPSLVNIDGKEYEPVKEGLAYILKPVTDSPPPQNPRGGASEPQASVFYNPIQQFNRDLSVIAIKAYANHVLASGDKPNKYQRQKKDRKSKKRKREDDSEDARNPVTAEGEQNGAVAVRDKEVGDGKLTASTTTDEQSPALSFRILDALSATGLRALRYAKEVPIATNIVANDLSYSAIDAIKTNIKYNGVEEVVRPNVGDARKYMYSVQLEKRTEASGKFDVIDLDPYGTAGPFLDAAVQAVKEGGLLCVTCTDAGIFASTGYPEKTFSLYGGIPSRLPYGHEVGLRLIVNAIATAAGKYGLSVEPLLSLSIDYYARIFVRVHKSPAEVKALAGTTMLLYCCDSGCGAWSQQYLINTKTKLSKSGESIYHHSLAQAPTTSQNCEHCGFKRHLAGPMWGGPLHNNAFIQKVLAMIPELDPETYQTLDRIKGMLTTALEEDLDYVHPQTPGSAEKPSSSSSEPQQQQQQQGSAVTTENEEKLLISPFIPRLSPHLKEKYPFFVSLSALSRVLHTQTISLDQFCGALYGLGYRATRSHTKPNSVRTDAPWDVIWEILREFVRQKWPLKEGALAPNSPGAGIMKKNRVNYEGQQALAALQQEIAEALESGTDVRDLTTKLQAALYRRGAQAPPLTSAVTTKPVSGHQNEEISKSNNQGKVSNGNISHPPERPHPSTLEIVFDEALGVKALSAKKSVVRYQMNPKVNWGPMNRASG
ncbi:S-adenosyl-L-methionine-dependent methyltransferase [Talaromyces proteolyticus]|uniref:tRNA (guanine(26)-N(2))-dimethyltransferase n=1 Tax=Talaromyces proteolyticus TaxID=1131652 RepID=A0AAD4PSW1_9EURO|nr:S-adenosyl-L-methionine-dependent methyltransferase [Talaromyces proteolyticus]KAH8689799.1 S-adenosyl-L-methionine-dependent methyltransferase [Talaromyces proteolyticus]